MIKVTILNTTIQVLRYHQIMTVPRIIRSHTDNLLIILNISAWKCISKAVLIRGHSICFFQGGGGGGGGGSESQNYLKNITLSGSEYHNLEQYAGYLR